MQKGPYLDLDVPLAEHSDACFRSYCYVKYASTQDAVRAIRMLNNRTLRPGYPPLKLAWYEKPERHYSQP
jgi:hypothetical protein